MRKIDLDVKAEKERFVLASPTHESYGIGCTVKDKAVETVIVFGDFEDRNPVRVIESIDELPLEFLMWYSSIFINMKTVNQKQQEGQIGPIEAKDIAALNGGIFYY